MIIIIFHLIILNEKLRDPNSNFEIRPRIIRLSARRDCT
jgi:hypothetical protein